MSDQGLNKLSYVMLCYVLESLAKSLQQNRVDSKGIFFICAIGINGGSSLTPAILYCWKTEEFRQGTKDTKSDTEALRHCFSS